MRRLKRNAVKESFDNLPSGICFFDCNGIVTLCNRQMYRLIYALTGRDLQSLPELRQLLDSREEGDVLTLEDGSAWHFSLEQVTTATGEHFTQAVAADVTQLYRLRQELEADNRLLEAQGKRLRKLFSGIQAVTREEEILNMKLRVHDDIGRSVLATRQLLQQGRSTQELDLTAWKAALHLLKREMAQKEDGLSLLCAAAESIGIKIHLNGALPDAPAAARLLLAALRECATNAARHAHASELTAECFTLSDTAYIRISNNGAAPQGEITESCGLGTLRSRIEHAGGTMTIHSLPRFSMTVAVPMTQEEPL